MRSLNRTFIFVFTGFSLALHCYSQPFWIGLNQNTDFVKVEERRLVNQGNEWEFVDSNEFKTNFNRFTIRFGYDSKRFFHAIEMSYSESFIPLKRKERISTLDQEINYFSVGYLIGKSFLLNESNISLRPYFGFCGYFSKSHYLSDSNEFSLGSEWPYYERDDGLKLNFGLELNYAFGDKVTLSLRPIITLIDYRNYIYYIENPAIPERQQLQEDSDSVLILPSDRSLSVGVVYYF